jgi:hypothetical protein
MARTPLRTHQVKSVVQFLDNQLTAPGCQMCICDQVYFEINRRGIQWTTENLKCEKK